MKPVKKATKKTAKRAAKKVGKKVAKKRPAHRPNTYSKQKAQAICQRLSVGEKLISICADVKMPSASTVYRWRDDNPEFREMYARAREDQAWHLFEEMVSIADDIPSKAYGEPGTGEASAKVQAEKIRIDTRKFFIAKVLPKIFGEKVTQEHTGPDGGPIKQESEFKVTPEDEEMIARIRERREKIVKNED